MSSVAQTPVVVAEDSETILELILIALRRDGVEAAAATTCAEALDRISEHRPRVVILDAVLPDGDGCDVCTRVRANASMPQPHVIVLTANARDADRERAVLAGADEFMTKPFSPRALAERVRTLLG